MMGPFAPDLVSDQLNLVVALFLGVGLGYVLEQAGSPSSRRQAGVFYGYDFTVLRVFFTAAVTAMSGVLLLGHFGLLDLGLIFVNPTWLTPAVVGGAVMGVGFILGGYCPGTGVCAAAIGGIDAFFFVGGGVLGVFAFAEAQPLCENVTILRGGLAEFQRVLLAAVPATLSGGRWDEDASAFREKARADILEQIVAGRDEVGSGPAKARKIVGGCQTRPRLPTICRLTLAW
jgi:hypothetical protein